MKNLPINEHNVLKVMSNVFNILDKKANMKHAEKIGYDVWIKVSSDENKPFTLWNATSVYPDFESAVEAVCDSVYHFVYNSEYDEIKNTIISNIKLNEEYNIPRELYSIGIKYIIRENDYELKQLDNNHQKDQNQLKRSKGE